LRHASNAAYDHRNAIVAEKAEVVEAERRFASGLIAEARGAAPPAGITIDEARDKVAALEAKTSHFAAAVDVILTGEKLAAYQCSRSQKSRW
jgi:hypothetical protein